MFWNKNGTVDDDDDDEHKNLNNNEVCYAHQISLQCARFVLYYMTMIYMYVTPFYLFVA